MEFDLIKILFGCIIAFDVLIYVEILKLKRKNHIKIELPNTTNSKTDNTMGYHLYVEYDNTNNKSVDNNGKN